MEERQRWVKVKLGAMNSGVSAAMCSFL